MILTVTLNAAVDKRYEVEHVHIGAVNRIAKCTYGAGGKGINVARVAALAGAEVMVTGLVGGHTGNLIKEGADKNGLPNDFVTFSGESRTCINIYDQDSHIQTEFLEEGEEVPKEAGDKMMQKYRELLNRADVVTISGSVPKGIKSQMYQEMIREARKRNVPLLLDTSGSLLKDCIGICPTLIKPNREEMELLTGKELISQEDFVIEGTRLQKQGIHYVLISLGAEGAILVAPKGIYKAELPKIYAVNTVGCGDSMLAGCAIGMMEGWEDDHILQYANALGAANAMNQLTGYFNKHDLDDLYPQVRIERIG